MHGVGKLSSSVSSYRVLFLNLLLHLVLVAGMDRLNLLLLIDDLLLLLVDELMIFCWIDISSLVEFWRKGYIFFDFWRKGYSWYLSLSL
jgi:hypothetical protein